jgi:hypothetical protein
MLRAIVPPLVAAYAVFVSMVILTWRRPAPRPQGRTHAQAPEPSGSFLVTVGGGYLVFLAIVLVFHVWLAGESDALASAVWGGLFLSSPMLGLSVLTMGIVRWSRGRKSGPRTDAAE